MVAFSTGNVYYATAYSGFDFYFILFFSRRRKHVKRRRRKRVDPETMANAAGQVMGRKTQDGIFNR